MPLPRNSRYVREGEVDPGVRDLASLLSGQFESTSAKVNYYTEVHCWFVASCGIGLFTYPKEALYKGLAMMVPEDPSTYMAGAPNPKNKPHGFPQYHHYVGNLSFGEGGLGSDDSQTFNETASTKIINAESIYRNLFKLHPNAELIVEALMFFDPSGKFGEILNQDRTVAEQVGIATAEAVASGVPIFGKKWIIALLVKYGVSPAEAASTAESVYFKQGNYLAFKDYTERFYTVQEILRKVDPYVSDAQVRDITNSPLPLEMVEQVARDIYGPGYQSVLDKPKDDAGLASTASEEVSSGGITGTTVAVAAGAGAIAAFAFGGPVGIAIGAGVLALSALFGGKKS